MGGEERRSGVPRPSAIRMANMNSTEPRVEPGASSSRARPWQRSAVVLLWVIASGIWMVAGPLTVRLGAYMSPQDAAWDGALVLHARFWFMTGTVDYVKGLVVQLPSGLAVVLWALYVVLVAAARRLGVRHWVAWFVVTPALLGQGIVGILYCSR